VWSITTAAQRRQVIDLLLPKVKYLGLAQREAFLAKLMERARCARLPLDLMMRSDQVVQICRAGMEIGGHTVSHPILCSVADDVAKAEITGGRERLESLLDKRVDLFAYPNGVPSRDYDERHVAMVRALGFRAAVSTAAGVATLASDIHQLPRYTPWASTQAGWNARLLRVRMQALAGAGQA
jgi:peptidoglycan/xylan/chitin deacetylase (PgdA/CDA1 family)